MQTPNQEYQNALTRFRTASAAFRAVQKQYRDRTIGDTEFLNARAAFDKAETEFDLYEQLAINVDDPFRTRNTTK